MIRHIVFIILWIAILCVGMFRPYMTGEYDHLAAGLSTIVQFGCLSSLLMVPIGLVGLILDLTLWKGKVPSRYATMLRRAILVIVAIITASCSLGAFVTQNASMAVIVSAIGVYVMRQYWTYIEQLRTRAQTSFHVAIYYLIIIPLTCFFIRTFFLVGAKESSTEHAIAESSRLIRDIEFYRKTNGHYPLALQSITEDYKPMVAGISRFHYEPSGDSYNLFFEQFSDRIGTREVVMYNPSNLHHITVHNEDLLRVARERIVKGYYETEERKEPGWRMFYFD